MVRHLIVVGDWVVDEFWNVVPRRSPTSTLVGSAHYEVLHGKESDGQERVFRSLCGAGLDVQQLMKFMDARVPGTSKSSNSRKTSSPVDRWTIHGVGVWNDNDTDIIGHLAHGCSEAQKSTTGLSISTCMGPHGLNLVNLGGKTSDTMRVARFFDAVKEDAQPMHRIDWLTRSRPKYTQGQIAKLIREGILPSAKTKGGVAIVVHDLAQYTVTEDLMRYLGKEYDDPNVHWYVRSKHQGETPRWIKDLGERLKLLVTGPENLGLIKPWHQWLLKGRITRQARRFILQHVGDPHLSGRRKRISTRRTPIHSDTALVMLSEAHEVIALTPAKAKGGDRAICARELEPTTKLHMNWPNIIFTQFVATTLRETLDERVITTSIETGARDAVEDGNSTAENDPAPTDFSAEIIQPRLVKGRRYATRWRHEMGQWHEWFRNDGIVEEATGKLRLEVWRSYTARSQYVAVIHEKREEINRIAAELRQFERSSDRRRHTSILLAADPGSGKSSLARALGDAFGFPLIKRDVSQMVRREDLIDLFDSVATLQAEQNRPVLVFVDEVNAELDGSHVFGAFLAPLEEGVYVRRSGSFRLRPCVWMFAGTDLDKEDVDKLPDFKSRVTHIARLDFKSLRALTASKKGDVAGGGREHWDHFEREAKLEYVCIGALMARDRFPESRFIDQAVIKKFARYEPGKPIRDIRVDINKLACRDRVVRFAVETIKDRNSNVNVRLAFEPG